MFNLQFLLLIVAVFQTVFSYPTFEKNHFEELENEILEKGTWCIIKEALRKFTNQLKDNLCTQKDYKENFNFVQNTKDRSIQLQVVEKQREILKKQQVVKEAANKPKVHRWTVKTKIYGQLKDVEEEMDVAESDVEEEGFSSMEHDIGIIKLNKYQHSSLKDIVRNQHQQIVTLLKYMLCNKTQLSHLDLDNFDRKDFIEVKLMEKIKEIHQIIQKTSKEKQIEFLEKLDEFRAKLCRFEDNNGVEKRLDWGQVEQKVKETLGNIVTSVAKKSWKLLKPALKLGVKTGFKIIKKAMVKITSFQCEGKTCSTCLSLVRMSACIKVTISMVKSVIHLGIAGDFNSMSVFEEKIRLGEVPRCVNAGTFIGNICLKSVEGTGKYNKNEKQINICLGLVAERYYVGLKMCTIYENNEFKMNVRPQLFVGGLDEDGDMIEANEEDENKGTLFSAD